MPIGTQCPQCKHYLGDLKCEAFPNGIPEKILTGMVDHRRPFVGDHGIRFERGMPTKKGQAKENK